MRAVSGPIIMDISQSVRSLSLMSQSAQFLLLRQWYMQSNDRGIVSWGILCHLLDEKILMICKYSSWNMQISAKLMNKLLCHFWLQTDKWQQAKRVQRNANFSARGLEFQFTRWFTLSSNSPSGSKALGSNWKNEIAAAEIGYFHGLAGLGHSTPSCMMTF